MAVEKKMAHRGSVNVARASARHFATYSSDGNVYVYDATNFSLAMSLVASKEEGFALDWESSGARIASGCNNGTVSVWDLEGREKDKPIFNFECGGAINDL